MSIPRMQRPCLEPGCGELSPPGKGRCDTHTRQANRAHNQKHAAYRDSPSRKARANQIASHPWCIVELAAATPCKGTLTCHHIDHDRANNSSDNLTTLCLHHHMRLEASHQRGHGAALTELANVLQEIQ